MGTNIQKRNQPGNETQDLGTIGNLTYNLAAGATKTMESGRHLLPFVTPGVGTGYTTNPVAAFPLPSRYCEESQPGVERVVPALSVQRLRELGSDRWPRFPPQRRRAGAGR